MLLRIPRFNEREVFSQPLRGRQYTQGPNCHGTARHTPDSERLSRDLHVKVKVTPRRGGSGATDGGMASIVPPRTPPCHAFVAICCAAHGLAISSASSIRLGVRWVHDGGGPRIAPCPRRQSAAQPMAPPTAVWPPSGQGFPTLHLCGEN